MRTEFNRIERDVRLRSSPFTETRHDRARNRWHRPIRDSIRMEELVALCKRRGFIFQSSRSTAASTASGTTARSASSSSATSRTPGGRTWSAAAAGPTATAVDGRPRLLDHHEPEGLGGLRPRRRLQRPDGRLPRDASAATGPTTWSCWSHRERTTARARDARVRRGRRRRRAREERAGKARRASIAKTAARRGRTSSRELIASTASRTDAPRMRRPRREGAPARSPSRASST